MKMQTIQIAIYHNHDWVSKPVEAYVTGDWAVHRSIERIGKTKHWTVSHIPTGLSITGMLQPKYKEAMQFAEMLHGANLPSANFSFGAMPAGPFATKAKKVFSEWKAGRS